MLEFNTPATSTPSASSMLSMLNINMEASRQNAFLLGNPPLAALHSMADIKSSPVGSYTNTQTLKPSPVGLQATCTQAATPHGINDILSRPAATLAPTLGTLSALPRFSLGVGAGMYFSPTNGGLHKLGLSELSGRPHLYWPGMMQNPALWRDRFTSAAAQSATDKDGKKKHTRPTFSGHQIYVLEKTFEQTKYLAGPERAKLAYALGMSESQVKETFRPKKSFQCTNGHRQSLSSSRSAFLKLCSAEPRSSTRAFRGSTKFIQSEQNENNECKVWFQNRRTKWRKKHAAEMATAKKKHDSEAEQMRNDDSSDAEELNSMDGKRFKRDEDGHSGMRPDDIADRLPSP